MPARLGQLGERSVGILCKIGFGLRRIRTVLDRVPERQLEGRGIADPVLQLAAWAEGLRRAFPDIEIRYAENAGHFVHYETPDEAAAAVAEFFSGPRVRWA